MKSIIIFLFLNLITTNLVIASGNYKQQSPPAIHTPYEKSEKSLKSYIYDLKRNNVSIHNISLEGNVFEIKGYYSRVLDFDNFVDNLRGNGEVDRKIEVIKKKDGNSGSISYKFEIKGLNLWK
ncbi:MAG: hypothetical protein HOJ35_12350 [Bdellovibrionales bacterium]|jgi:hypothetical protein|nr:hypothetical protein [Bdellovibrionales bacterium]